MTERRTILVVNDDGISAPGIKHLVQAVSNFGDVFVVAPEFEQSGVGLCITTRQSLQIKQVSLFNGIPSWSVSGTPADCVKIALSVLLDKVPDVIVSGINPGCNGGRNFLYSGTVGGVIEGVLRGIPGIAFSLFDMINPRFELFTPYIPSIVEYVLKHPLPKGTMMNVNFPCMNLKYRRDNSQEIRGFKLATQGKLYIVEEPEEVEEMSYLLGFRLQEFDEHEESDIHLLQNGYIACSPVHVDELTDKEFYRANKHGFETFMKQSDHLFSEECTI